MPVTFGIIAEDFSDVEVVKKFAKKLLGRNISTRYFVGKGCGQIKKKLRGWCNALEIKGCSQVILVHDLDRRNAETLRAQLQSELNLAPQKKKVLVVPIEELEAWLLSDHLAIKAALKLRRAIKEEHHPERVPSPKEHLGRLILKASDGKVTYVNTVHNTLITDHVDISLVKKKCPSFLPLAQFFTR